MLSRFARRICRHVEDEIALAIEARTLGDPESEFSHLENAHVLGQASTYWHVKVHLLMLAWAIRNRSLREVIGQIIRVVGAATKTAIGLIPKGNTGGSNVSPFRVLPIRPEIQKLIDNARTER